MPRTLYFNASGEWQASGTTRHRKRGRVKWKLGEAGGNSLEKRSVRLCTLNLSDKAIQVIEIQRYNSDLDK